jgi:hypothetical protein
MIAYFPCCRVELWEHLHVPPIWTLDARQLSPRDLPCL